MIDRLNCWFKPSCYTKAIVIVAALFVLNACSTFGLSSKSASPAGSFASSPTCKNNPFLQKYDCSFDRIDQAARSGDPDAQYALGYLYFYGVGTHQDTHAGQVWIEKAAAQGQPLAVRAQRLMSQNGYTSISSGGGSGRAYRDNSTDVEALNSNKSQQTIGSVLPGYSKKSNSGQTASDTSTTNSSNDTGAAANADTSANDANTTPTAGLSSNTKQPLTPGEQHLLATNSNYYTIQLMGSHNPRALEDFVKQNGLSGAFYYSMSAHDGNWYNLIYGTYPSKQSASAAVSKLPASVQKLHPWIKPMRVVQQQIKAKSGHA